MLNLYFFSVDIIKMALIENLYTDRQLEVIKHYHMFRLHILSYFIGELCAYYGKLRIRT